MQDVTRAIVRRATVLLFLLALLVIVSLTACGNEERNITLATTTSTENSGLLDVLLPVFEEQTGYNVRALAVGSGAALRLGEQGDVDVILSHAPAAEEVFVESGYGIDRTRVMYNDFVIVGPPADPAGVEGLTDATEAFRRIAEAGARFASRGDDSGTHETELELWGRAGLSVPVGEAWYMESGQGMAETLTIAAEREAYVLSDRATWLEVADPERLPLLVEGDDRLRNVYHIILVNPERHPHVNEEGARAFMRFLVSPETQATIGSYGVQRYGEPLFIADAADRAESR